MKKKAENAKELGFLIKNINDNIEAQSNQLLKSMDLTISQVRVLHFLHEKKVEEITQREIESFLQVSRPTVIGIIKRLETKGLVKSFLKYEQKPIKYIRITEAEQEFYKKLKNIKKTIELGIVDGITESEHEQLYKILNKIHNNSKGIKNLMEPTAP